MGLDLQRKEEKHSQNVDFTISAARGILEYESYFARLLDQASYENDR